ncbi:MAG: DUF1778 domain-containing protein [Planctomycetaceae bacterium]|nr:MAG: DUF1778 domain-containing protein [Planctomycetaceae bacterium]
MKLKELRKKRLFILSVEDRLLLELAAEKEGMTLQAFMLAASKAAAEKVMRYWAVKEKTT